MLKKLRKSSGSVSLVLIGVAALAGCGDHRRDVYATQQDCLADWGNSPKDCSPATDSRHSNRGYWYGPSYAGHTSSGSNWSRSSGTFSSARSSGATGSSSRGGFGSSGRGSSS